MTDLLTRAREMQERLFVTLRPVDSKDLATLMAELVAEVEQCNALFDMQWKRSTEADERWRKAHPGNELVRPDLGDLLAWLMAEIDGYKATVEMSVGAELRAQSAEAARDKAVKALGEIGMISRTTKAAGGPTGENGHPMSFILMLDRIAAIAKEAIDGK